MSWLIGIPCWTAEAVELTVAEAIDVLDDCVTPLKLLLNREVLPLSPLAIVVDIDWGEELPPVSLETGLDVELEPENKLLLSPAPPVLEILIDRPADDDSLENGLQYP